MQYKCLLEKKVTKRIFQTLNSKAHYLDGLNFNKKWKIYPFYLIPQQGIEGMSQAIYWKLYME